jgi:hypothetical protein
VANFAHHLPPEAGGFARVPPGSETRFQLDLPHGGQGAFSMNLKL